MTQIDVRPTKDAILRVLDQARWAPSGDNQQPWRFEITSPRNVVVHAPKTGDGSVYDLKGHATDLAIGALLETIRIAATTEGMRTQIARLQSTLTHRWHVEFVHDDTVTPDALATLIPQRSTQRRPLRTTPLQTVHKEAVERAIDDGFSIHWVATTVLLRSRFARLLSLNSKLRLTLPEAYPIHRRIIHWDARYSADRIPDKALGVDPVLRPIMRWALKSWERNHFLNRYLGGTLAPRLEMELIPAITCASHFVIAATDPPRKQDDFIRAGATWQRQWLTATSCGLWIQPEMTPLIFAEYVRDGVTFTQSLRARRLAEKVARGLEDNIGASLAERAVVLGRIGYGRPPKARSVRLPLNDLIMK